MGVFNLNLLNYDNHVKTNEFLNTMNSNFLLPYIHQPTRITDKSATVIDNIYANTLNYNSLSGNIVSKISDHLPQFLIVENFKVTLKMFPVMKMIIHISARPLS